VDGQDVASCGASELYDLRRRVGYVFQFAALFDSMTVFDNVAMGLRRCACRNPRSGARAESLQPRRDGRLR
jgi:ABC-type transporter Mla maintaining outer membrane lipid asymmetry ATPase subunit MlaF